MTYNPNAYETSKEAHRFGLYAIVGASVVLAVPFLFSDRLDLSPQVKVLLDGAIALALVFGAVLELVRLFDPARKKANDEMRWFDRENIEGERFWGVASLLMAMGMAYFPVQRIRAEHAYSHPLFFLAPTHLLILVGRQFQLESKADNRKGVDDVHSDIIAVARMGKHRVGLIFMIAGAVLALCGGARFWLAQS